MKHSTNTDKELKKSALYQVWCDMLRSARRETEFYTRHGFAKPFRVDEEFREFDTFALWAKFNQGYEIGRDDHKQLARRDIHETFNPDNCYFCERQDYIKELDTLEAEITKGASQIEYKRKDERGKWHGLSDTRLYEIWKGMCRRCSDPKQKDYPDYGARGICVCDEWRKDFLAFENWAWEHGYNVDLSIDRINVDGNYCPDNCRWASYLEQKLNTRKERATYKNIRLKVKRMKELLQMMPDDAVVTLIARCDKLPDQTVNEDDYPAVPINERIDIHRKR